VHPLEEVIGAALSRLARSSRAAACTRVCRGPAAGAIDDVLVEQVLINLLDNAIKYTPPESPIRINGDLDGRSRGPSRSPTTGRGCRARGRSDLREVLSRPSRPRSRLGLGLAICQGIVKAHGGRIWAQNLPEGGVAFLFTLPRVGTPPAVPADA